MLTDPATELYDLCVSLQSSTASDRSTTRVALANAFLCAPDDPLFFAILAALAGRFDSLLKIVDRPQNGMSDDVRRDSRQSIKHLWAVFATDGFMQQWDGRKNSIFTAEHLRTLKFTGALIKNSHTLRKPTRVEREAAIEKIDAVLADIEIDSDGSSLVQDAVSSALMAVKAILERFEFFGIDVLTEKLLWAHAGLSAVKKTNNSPERGSLIGNALIALAIVAQLVNIGSDGPDAGRNFSQYGQAAIDFIIEHAPVVPLALLPAPDPNATDEPDPSSPGEPVGT